MRVTKAVIPAAGRGTRMAPFSRIVPKELVPLGVRPALLWVLEEARAAGIEEIGLIVGPGKHLLREFVEVMADEQPVADLRFDFIVQEDPRGLAEAMSICRDFADGQAFALLLPDNILMEDRPSLGRMVDLAQELGKDVVGIMEVDPSRSGHFSDCGRIEYREIRAGVYDIEKLEGKVAGPLIVPQGESILRTCGRYICQPHVFDYIDLLRSEVQGEYSEVPVYQRIIRDHGAIGSFIPGPLFDVGNPRGYLAASAHLAASPA